ncbi:hypothetical protein D3C73_1311030 [compost metagenome]
MLAQATVDKVGEQSVQAYEEALRPAQVQVAMIIGDGAQHCRRHLLWLVDPGLERVVERLCRHAVHARAGRTRGHVQHIDAGVGQFTAQRLGESAQGEFAGTVGGVARIGDRAIGRAHIHHHGTFGLAQ